MAIFNSYVKLPEGIWKYISRNIISHMDDKPIGIEGTRFSEKNYFKKKYQNSS